MNRKSLFWVITASLTGALLLLTVWGSLRNSASAVAGSLDAQSAAPGAVVINEVAWMGTAAEQNDEWMELFNNSAYTVVLTNWTLAADDGIPDITLNGSILPHGYYLLERENDGTIIDIAADQIYSGALDNDPGADTLRLQDSVGTLIDVVNADGGAWPAGIYDSKHTMERIDPDADGADGNWATNDGFTRNGVDAGLNKINGTPRARNSAYIPPALATADLSVTKTGPTLAAPGGAIRYTIRLSNTGSLTATGVNLTDVLPGAVAFLAQNSAFPFSHTGYLLTWSVVDVPPTAEPMLISVMARVSDTAPGFIQNVVTVTTVTTESTLLNNTAGWVTTIVREPGQKVLISALLYDGYQHNDRDEAVELINLGDASADLAGWSICNSAVGGSCAAIVAGILGANESAWLTYWADAFFNSFGFSPDYAVAGLRPESKPLSGTWPRYANETGGVVVLKDRDGSITDTLVYGQGDTSAPGWTGAAVEPWRGSGGFRLKGQILYRRLDETIGRPIPDTDSADDWAQYSGDPYGGRRVRYPGWDLQTLFHPLVARETAHLIVGVAPDNAAEVLLSAIDAAQDRVEIAVFELTHPTIIQRLVARASEGVSVTVLLEGDPPGVAKTDPRWYQQLWGCQSLSNTGHGGCWFMITDDSSNVFDRYRYMHAKYALIDRQQVLISTQNFTALGLPADDHANGTYGSRGVILQTDAPSLVARVAQIFDLDLDPSHHADLLPWTPTSAEYGPPPPSYAPVLSVTDYASYTVVFSQPLALVGAFDFELFTAPEAALRQSDALLGLLGRAGAGDEVYVEALDERAHWGENAMDDPSLRMEAYIGAARRGARVRLLLNSGQFDAAYYEDTDNVAAAAYANNVAQEEGLDLRAAAANPTGYGIHNKMVLVWLEGEGGHAHVGSLNGSESSNKVNRELAVQVKSDTVYAYLKQVFDWDWYTSHPLFLPLLVQALGAPD